MPYVTRAQYNEAKVAGIVTPPGPAAFLDKLVKAQMVFDLNGQQCMNVLYFLFTDTPTLITMGELALAIADGWDDSMGSHLSERIVLNQIILTDLSAPGGTVLPFSVTPPLPGGNTSADPAPFVALSVRKVTEAGGRANRGFMRIAGLVSGQFTLGLLTDVAATQLQNDMDDFLTAISGPDWLPVLVSFYVNGAPRTVPQLSAILGFEVKLKVTTQNSRKIGRGV